MEMEAQANENKGPDEDRGIPEEAAKSSKRKPRVRGKVKAGAKDEANCLDACLAGCANLNVKSIWVVGVAVIILVTVFCFAMISNPGKPASQIAPMMAQPVAMTIPPEGFVPYPMDPVLQWGMQGGMQGMQPVASYGPNCPIYPNAGASYPPAAAGQQMMAGNYYGNNPNVAPYYPQPAVMQPVAAVQPAQSMTPQAPPIFRDAVMKHEYRGVCENCHKIL